MNLIDFHCDTIYKFRKDNILSLLNNDLSIDLSKLKKSNSLAQFFALFVCLEETENPFEEAMEMFNIFINEMNTNSNYIKFSKSYNQLIDNIKNGYISSFLTLEEGAVIEGSLDKLKEFFNLGVRLMTLTWNYPNDIGFPNFELKYNNLGLTTFGKDVVQQMNELSMIIDVSHLSDKGFYDVADISSKPFIASHSNSRSITNHYRNLTDDMIKELANKGGVMGLNFERTFLGRSSYGTVSEMITHLKHIINVGGINSPVIGSDFDGIDTPSEINNIGQMDKLYYGLKENKFSEDEIEKIFYKNAMRFLKDSLPII